MSERPGFEWMYPVASGAGLSDKSQGCWIPTNLAAKFIKNGTWSKTPNFSNPNVTKSIVEKAKAEISSERQQLDADKAELKRMMDEFKAMQQGSELKVKKVVKEV